jgi:hypothetical protein
VRDKGEMAQRKPPPGQTGERKGAEPACKPGSVEDSHSSRIRVTAYLMRPTRERCGPHLPAGSGWQLPYLVLLRVGFALPLVLPPARCALTAPFHPYRRRASRHVGGMFSVALSVNSRPPGVTWHPALWSPDFPRHRFRCRDCPADSFPTVIIINYLY